MTTFRDEAEKILDTYTFSSMGGQRVFYQAENGFIDALTALHEREVERIIGEDYQINFTDTGIGYKTWVDALNHHVNMEKDNQRRRANGEGGE